MTNTVIEKKTIQRYEFKLFVYPFSSVEAWERATEADPLFVLQVPWLPTGKSLRDVAERIFANAEAKTPDLNSAGHLARIVFSSQRKT